MLNLIGGLIGVGLGYLIAQVAGEAVAAAGYAVFKPVFTWQLVVYTLIFAFLVGIGSGIFPAYRASKLKPVDSLRYE